MSDRDVLRPDIEMATLEGDACSFSLRGGSPLVGSVEGAFSEPRGELAAQLRHCLDSDLNSIGCGQPHHGEVVGVASAEASCQDVAAAFLGWNASSLPAGISLSTRGQPQECLITVKGANVLTSTLREIGRLALPIEPSS